MCEGDTFRGGDRSERNIPWSSGGHIFFRHMGSEFNFHKKVLASGGFAPLRLSPRSPPPPPPFTYSISVSILSVLRNPTLYLDTKSKCRRSNFENPRALGFYSFGKFSRVNNRHTTMPPKFVGENNKKARKRVAPTTLPEC